MKIDNEQVIGINSQENDRRFSVLGCENCNNTLGNDVTDCIVTTENHEEYEVALCHGCLCAYYNGEELPEDCENIFKI